MPFENTIDPGVKEQQHSPVIYIVGGIVLCAILAFAFFLSRSHQGAGANAKPLPITDEDRAYLDHIHISNAQMSRSTNFLNQEFTYVTGTVSNDGNRNLQALEITLEFHDPFNQLILRERNQIVPASGPGLAPGQQRDFQITLEHIPSEWNQQYPTLRLTGMLLK